MVHIFITTSLMFNYCATVSCHFQVYISYGTTFITYYTVQNVYKINFMVPIKNCLFLLQSSVSDYLRAMLSIRNVCLIYDTASLYALQDLIAACRTFMDKHATDILGQESFISLSSSGVREIISRDSFCAPEVII